MIIPLLLSVNPVYPQHLVGTTITLPTKRIAIIERVMSDGRLRLLVDSGLPFKTPCYMTTAQLTALTTRETAELAAAA